MSYSFHRLGPSVAMLVCAALVPGLAAAQSGTKPGVSPVSPPTLKAPVFDTTKPDYNVPSTKKAADTVVAEVDGRPITLGDVADAIKNLPTDMQNLPYDDLFPIVQNRLIAKQALVIQAQQKGLDTDSTVRRRIKAASDDLLANEYVHRAALDGISEQALLDRYARDIAGKPGPEEVHIRVIAVPTQAAAQDILKALQAGGDFATIAKASSTDSSASVGGDLGFITRTSLNPELGGAAFAATPGQLVGGPVQSNGAWFIVKVEERRRQPTPTYSVVRDQLEQAMILERAPDVAKQALSGVKVRVFGVNGREIEDLPPDADRKSN